MMMQNANTIITTMEDNVSQVIMTQSLDKENNSEKVESFKDESEESLQKKCYILRKILAHQIKPNLGCLPHTIRTIPRLKPFRAFRSILDKSLPCADLLSHSSTLENQSISHSDGLKYHLLGPLNSKRQDRSTRPNQVHASFDKDDQINIFGAMAVSFKADFLQNCAAALLRKRVSLLINNSEILWFFVKVKLYLEN